MASNTTVAILAVVLVGGAAAGTVAFTDVLGGGQSAVDQVPGGVDVVVSVDGDVTTDEVTRRIFESQADDTVGDGPESASDALSEFEDETGLDPEQFDQAVAFGQLPQGGFFGSDGETYAGFIFHANWDNDAVLEELRNESTVELEADTYNGQPIYRPAEEPTFGSATAYGVLGDGQFVGGTEAAVEDAIDVSQGDADTFGGDLRSAYENTPEGLTKFALRVPSEQVPDGGTGGFGPDYSQFQRVDIVAGSYYTGANNAGVEIQMITDSQSDATDVKDVIEGAIAMLTGFSEESPMTEHLDEVEVTQSGSTVVVSYEQSVDSIEELLEYYEDQQGAGFGA